MKAYGPEEFSQQVVHQGLLEYGVPEREADILSRLATVRAMYQDISGYNPEMAQLVFHAEDRHEEPFLVGKRREIRALYGYGSFGEILCGELHGSGDESGLTFKALATKWNISLSTLGELIWDHCKRLEE